MRYEVASLAAADVGGQNALMMFGAYAEPGDTYYPLGTYILMARCTEGCHRGRVLLDEVDIEAHAGWIDEHGRALRQQMDRVHHGIEDAR